WQTLVSRLVQLICRAHEKCSGRCSSFLEQTCDPDQNYRPDKGHNDGPYHPTTLPNSQHAKDPAAEKSAQDAKNDVHENPVPPALHHLTSKPSSDESHKYPSEKSHLLLHACAR